MMHSESVVWCTDSRNEAENRLGNRTTALEIQVMKVSGKKAEFLQTEGHQLKRSIRLLGDEMPNVWEFKCVGPAV